MEQCIGSLQKMSSINLISPTTFTTAVLIGDATDTGNSPTMTEVGGTTVSAALEVQSTKGGFLPPRMTTLERDEMSAGTKEITNGLMIYNTDDDLLNVYQGGNWEEVETTGNGFVVGPNASVINNIAVFNNGEGDLIADSGIKAYQNNGNFFVATPASGSKLDAGAANVGIGGANLSAVTDGSYNVAVGDGNLLFLTTGDSNTSIGTLTLENATKASNSTAVGFRALNKSDANENTAVGSNALELSTTGTLNTAVGVNALKENVVGDNISAFGNRALEANLASNNVAVGSISLNKNTTGTFNTAVGYSSLYNNVTGSNNTSVGSSALFLNVGGNNTAVGQSSLLNNSTGSANVAIGYLSNATTSTADGNIGIGYQSLNGTTTKGGNTAVGTSAGYLAKSNFSECTFIGILASSANVNLAGSTAIGANTVVNTDNSINLGNGCNVGINNPSPAYNLDIAAIGNNCGIKMAYAQTAPAATPNSGYLYIANDGTLHYRGPTNDTTIAPA